MAEKILGSAIEGAHMLPMGRFTFWRVVGARMLPQPVGIGGLSAREVFQVTRPRANELSRSLLLAMWKIAELRACIEKEARPLDQPSTVQSSIPPLGGAQTNAEHDLG